LNPRSPDVPVLGERAKSRSLKNRWMPPML